MRRWLQISSTLSAPWKAGSRCVILDYCLSNLFLKFSDDKRYHLAIQQYIPVYNPGFLIFPHDCVNPSTHEFKLCLVFLCIWEAVYFLLLCTSFSYIFIFFSYTRFNILFLVPRNLSLFSSSLKVMFSRLLKAFSAFLWIPPLKPY